MIFSTFADYWKLADMRILQSVPDAQRPWVLSACLFSAVALVLVVVMLFSPSLLAYWSDYILFTYLALSGLGIILAIISLGSRSPEVVVWPGLALIGGNLVVFLGLAIAASTIRAP
jgi:hypothetical protein